MMTIPIDSWWLFLCAVATFNIAAWSLAAAALQRRRPTLSADAYVLRRALLVLSGIYVAGCAYRSFFPVYDVPRIAVVDSWLSSVLIGRSVATLAELAFVAQWALLLREAARAAGSTAGRLTALALVPMIAIAETCSWYSVLTTSNLGHTAEESLWGLAALLVVASLAGIVPRIARSRRPLLIAWCAAGGAYVAYMFLVDVPLYWSRWLADEAHARHYLSIAQGIIDVSRHRVVSTHWADWKNEVVWMSLYFSVAVWLSIAFINAPLPRPPGARQRRPAALGCGPPARSTT